MQKIMQNCAVVWWSCQSLILCYKKGISSLPSPHFHKHLCAPPDLLNFQGQSPKTVEFTSLQLPSYVQVTTWQEKGLFSPWAWNILLSRQLMLTPKLLLFPLQLKHWSPLHFSKQLRTFLDFAPLYSNEASVSLQHGITICTLSLKCGSSNYPFIFKICSSTSPTEFLEKNILL